MPISELLYNFKQQVITPSDIALLLQRMKQHQLQQVPLWRVSSLVRLTTGTAKVQAYLIIYAGLLFLPPAIYEKYQDNPDKIYRLAVYTPIAFLFMLAPLYFYRRSSSRLLTAIDYHHPSNCFELQTYRK